MELIKYGIKKHPYLSLFSAWFLTFMTFGCFEVGAVLPVNYLSPVVFASAVVIFEYLFMKKKNIDDEKLKKDLIKTIIVVLSAAGYLIITLAVFFFFFHMSGMTGRNSIITLVFLTFPIIVFSVYLTIRKKWTYYKAVVTLLSFSYVLHLFFLMYSMLIYQYDQGSFFGTEIGHFGYIKYIYNNYSLPQFDPRLKWQYYHPPLNHIICAVFLRIQTAFGVNFLTAADNLTFLPFLYFMNTLIIFHRLSLKTGLEKKYSIYILAVTSFSVGLHFTGGYVNNDMLSVMFMMLAVSLSINWYKNRKISNMIPIAICFGLGMFTKLSMWMCSVPIAVLFISALIDVIRRKQFKDLRKMIGQMCVFLTISVPMSLYWSVRNLVRFGVPLAYIPVSGPEGQHIDADITKRLFDFDLSQFDKPYVANVLNKDSYNEYNPLIALIKSSMGTTALDSFFIPKILFPVVLIISVISFVCMIYVLVKKHGLDPVYKLMFLLFYLVVLVSYYIFCIKYPGVCTEEIRYATPVIFIGAYFISYTLMCIDKKKKKALSLFIRSVVVLFVLLSAADIVCDGIMNAIEWMTL